MLLRLATSIAGALAAYVLYRILKIVHAELTSPLRYLPGPKSKHWFFGHDKELRARASGVEERWVERYGRVIRLHQLLSRSQLYIADTKALHHILASTHIYQKSEPVRFSLGRIVGEGLLVVEGDVHRQQNPAFGAPQIRELTGIFVEKSIQLRDIWATQISGDGGIARVEIVSWLSKATLDIIGLADRPDELSAAFDVLFRTETQFSLMRAIQAFCPIFRPIPLPIDKISRQSHATMRRIGRELLADSKRDIAETGTFETGQARDLLNLLVPTFFIAGHETTSTAMAWALFALTQNMGAQARLREELLSVETDSPSMEDLNSLPYLDCVVRETLRANAPVTNTSRIALCDDIVPLSTPFTDTRGTVQETLRIRKGDTIIVPILALNRDKEIWGPDAMEFIPERWESATPISNALPTMWGQMLTFLGGPRGCIGYRFSLVEMKALLFTLVRSFEFELAVPITDIGKRPVGVVQKPFLIGDPDAGNQLPLLVRPAARL
ncbi:cytochrome P450 [Mycena rosella]|uniref:Cytochrome P450 n=1 Tax=Mycena rosella TaxID=1033263 RepID=A0AAD7CTR2_MYCRO|nr:cytochrome P450 [Mycena rosella]